MCDNSKYNPCCTCKHRQHSHECPSPNKHYWESDLAGYDQACSQMAKAEKSIKRRMHSIGRLNKAGVAEVL